MSTLLNFANCMASGSGSIAPMRIRIREMQIFISWCWSVGYTKLGWIFPCPQRCFGRILSAIDLFREYFPFRWFSNHWKNQRLALVALTHGFHIVRLLNVSYHKQGCVTCAVLYISIRSGFRTSDPDFVDPDPDA
jgi:hypothetical protein